MNSFRRWRMIAACGLVFAFLSATVSLAETRAEPKTWTLWRCGPIPFPDVMNPVVPELSRRPPIDFGRFGEDLCVVYPDSVDADSRDERALFRMAQLIGDKTYLGRVVDASKLSDEDRSKTLLVLGTLQTNPVARKALSGDRSLLDGVPPGGYAIKTVASPYDPDKKCILALGADAVGAWAAAEVMAYSIHPEKTHLGSLRRWTVDIPDGTNWIPFEAKTTHDPNLYEIRSRPAPAPPKPRIPFSIRIWGSPMPTLGSYQRVIRALVPTGVDTVVVQSGGWVDLPDAPQTFVKALDIAWQEGLYTILYVGNEETGHLPAPLSPAHRAVVMATKDHPGLLGWHLYNQLAATLTAEQQAMVKEQLAWLRGVSDKPIGNEIVWGHNLVEIPDDKQQLIRDLKRWGNDVIATDYAPIGGWAEKPILSRWEARLRELARLDVPMEAVLQAHVPFREPTVPSPEELRNQYWWCVATGVRGFHIETAFLFTHFSVRGLLSWTAEPLPDGRYDEVRELTAITRKLEDMLVESRPLEPANDGHHVMLVASRQPLALRLRASVDGTLYAILINSALDTKATGRLTIDAADFAYEVTDVLTGTQRGRLDSDRRMFVEVQPGGGVVYRMKRMAATAVNDR